MLIPQSIFALSEPVISFCKIRSEIFTDNVAAVVLRDSEARLYSCSTSFFVFSKSCLDSCFASSNAFLILL